MEENLDEKYDESDDVIVEESDSDDGRSEQLDEDPVKSLQSGLCCIRYQSESIVRFMY